MSLFINKLYGLAHLLSHRSIIRGLALRISSAIQPKPETPKLSTLTLNPEP